MEKRAEHSGLTGEEKVNAFRIERADDANTNPNLSGAAAWASLISSGRKSIRDIPRKKRASGLDYERVKTEGVWEDDPPELKKYFALYEEYRKEKDKWNIPIPDKLFKKLGKLSDSGETDKYLDELSNLIGSWMKNQPPETLSELLHPDEDRVKSLERMAKPWEEGGLGIPFPEKYPFEVYFLTCNTIARLYGMRPEIMNAILSRISKVWVKTKQGERLVREEPEALSQHYEGYESTIKHLANITARKISDLQAYLNTTIENLRKPKATRIIPESDLPKKQVMHEEGVEEEERSPLEAILQKGLSNSAEEAIKFKETYDLVDKTLAFDEEKMQRRIDIKSVLSSMKKERREAIWLRLAGYTQKETALKMGVSVKTIFLWEQDFVSRMKN